MLLGTFIWMRAEKEGKGRVGGVEESSGAESTENAASVKDRNEEFGLKAI